MQMCTANVHKFPLHMQMYSKLILGYSATPATSTPMEQLLDSTSHSSDGKRMALAHTNIHPAAADAVPGRNVPGAQPHAQGLLRQESQDASESTGLAFQTWLIRYNLALTRIVLSRLLLLYSCCAADEARWYLAADNFLNLPAAAHSAWPPFLSSIFVHLLAVCSEPATYLLCCNIPCSLSDILIILSWAGRAAVHPGHTF